MKQSSNESGITLIEVLATLTITAIISSVVYAVFFQTLHAKEKTQSHNELRQEANIVMTQLRTMHENDEEIAYRADMLYKVQDVPLATKNYRILEVKITNLDVAPDSDLIDNTPKDYQVLPSTSTLEVHFKMEDPYKNEYVLETVFPGKTGLAIKIPDNNSDVPPYVFTKKEEFETLKDEDFSDYKKVTFNKNNYEFFGDSQTKDSSFSEKKTGKNPTINGNALFLNKKGITTSKNIDMIIGKSLYNNGGYTAKSKSSLTVKENALISGKLTTNNKSYLTVGYNLYIKNKALLKKDSSVVVGGSVRMDNDLTISNNGEFLIGNYMFLSGKLNQNKNSKLIIGKDLVVGDVSMKDDSIIEVGGNADFNGNLDLGKGSICVKGTATFANKNVYKTVENVPSCNNQPTGTIYVLNQPKK